jgi:hypothetical protein
MGTIVGLSHFQIKGNGVPSDATLCQVYINGRQQVQIDIVIDAVDAQGQIVHLTPEQIGTVRLINYDDGANIDGRFVRSLVKNIYEFYDGTRPTEIDSSRQNMNALTFYIAMPSTAHFARINIAAEITLNGATYRTNNRGSAAGGQIDKGGFNSSIVLQPMPAYLFSANYFQIHYQGVIGFGDLTEGPHQPKTFFRWEITFKDPNFRILGSDIPDTYPTNAFSQYVRSGGDKDTRHWALPIRPVGQDAHLGAARQGDTIHDVFILPYEKTGAAYAIHEEQLWLADSFYTSKRIMYIDQNGCGHYVYLRPNSNGTTFEIFDTAKPASDACNDHSDLPQDPTGAIISAIGAATKAAITAAVTSLLASIRRK